LFYASSADALFNSKIDKAKSFMKDEIYSSSLSLLEEVLNENPNNVEALYLSGICYIYQRKYNQAEKIFSDVIRINSDYRHEIANAYKKAADDSLYQGIFRPSMYKKAIYYVHFLRKDIAMHLYNIGRGNRSNTDELVTTVSADELFTLAIELDHDLSRKVATYYYNISRQSDDGFALNAFKKAAKYHPMYKSHYENRIVEFGERFLRKAKRLARVPGREEETEELKKLFEEILGKQVALVELPEYRLYDPGEYIFTLNAGEQTDHWIRLNYKKPVTFSLSSSDYNFVLVYDNGTKIKGDHGVMYPLNEKSRFKIQNVSYKKNILMTVKMKNQ